MAVTSFINSTSALSSQTYAFSALQSPGNLHEKEVARLGTSRLVRDSNGSIHLIEKTPAEVIGEKIRPLIDKISALISCVFSFPRYLPSFPSLPVADAKEMHSPDGAMRFPSQEALVSCLDGHPLTGRQATQYLSEQGITEAVAKSFADQKKLPLQVMEDLLAVNKEKNLGLPNPVLITFWVNLVEALKDCATGAEISEESSTAYNHKSDL